MSNFICTDKAVDDTPPDLEARMDRLVAESVADMEVARRLMDKDPRLSIVSAVTMAGDLRSLERSKRWVESGERTFDRSINYVGSFGRVEFLLWGIEHGYTTPEAIFPDLPELWRAADPDDTDPRALDLWKAARRANGGKYLRDGRALPRGKTIRVYRGQDDDAPLGIAWTTDLAIAEAFARGRGTRQANRGGTVIAVDVPRDFIIAYITGRNESEVILDPANIERTDLRE